MPKQFPPEVREQALRLMGDHVADYPGEAAAIRSSAPKCQYDAWWCPRSLSTAVGSPLQP
jgi:hypothetical protein